jgi:hypothetical protein
LIFNQRGNGFNRIAKVQHEYLTNWLADIIQNPGKKSGTAVVLKSKPQAGKGTLMDLFRDMTGYVSETSNPQGDIFGAHGNAYIEK